MIYRFTLGFLIFLTGFISCRQAEKKNDSTDSQAVEQETGLPKANPQEKAAPVPQENPKSIPLAGEIETDTILGAWLRPDGNYILEFTAVNADNSLEANYYNPRPINISMAQVKKEDRIKIYVEFDDANYRGSYYDLQYDAANDALTGNYYQATYGQTYPIAFIRYEEPQ
jgi:hypothetical protein